MSIWDVVAGPIIAIINKVVPDKAAAAAAVAQLTQMQLQGQLADEMAQLQAVTVNQTDINKVEAASTSLFVAGWRPYIGWVCGTGLGIDCVLRPTVNVIAALFGHPLNIPVITDPILQSTMAGLLGLGHISRTVEKVKGVVGSH